MRAYALLSQLPYLKSYLGKIMVAAFLGTHIPLVALVVFLLVVTPIDFSSALYILVIVLVATIVAAVSTLYVLYALLAPVSLTSSALRGYLDDNEVPDLPTNFNDRAGRLMADVQYTVGQLDEVIRSLEEQSSRDYLTGVYNRRAGEERLAEDVAWVERGGGSLTLAVLDLDQLKPVNDQYGHQAGDACLKHIADTVRRNIRESDWLARWGGDEFVLVLRDARGKSSAEVMLERIVRDLDKTRRGFHKEAIYTSPSVRECPGTRGETTCKGSSPGRTRLCTKQKRVRETRSSTARIRCAVSSESPSVGSSSGLSSLAASNCVSSWVAPTPS